MKKAWIENNVIRDIAQGNPAEIYHPDIAAHYSTNVPDDAENGDGWVNSALVKRPAPVVPTPTPEAPKPPTVGPNHFKLLFTVQEGVTAKGLRATDPVLDYFWSIVDDPRTDVVDLALTSVQNAVEYTLTKVKAAGVSVDVPARKAQILTGVLT